MQTRYTIETMNKMGHAIKSFFTFWISVLEQDPQGLDSYELWCARHNPKYVHAAAVHGAAMLETTAASSDKDGKTERLVEHHESHEQARYRGKA